MKINTSNVDLTKMNKIEKQVINREAEKRNIDYSYGVKTEIDRDLIDKMEIIAKVMENEEVEDLENDEKIKEIKNKIENNQYSVDPMEIINKIERGE